MALNELPDVEVDLQFGRTYMSFELLTKLALAMSGLYAVSDHPVGPDLIAEFVNFQLLPLTLGLHVLGVLLSIYIAKRSTGHKRSLSLPHYARPIRGDPSKGPFIRRTVLKIKAFIFRISPLKTILHGCFILICVWILTLYVTVCFGAPLLSDHFETLTFTTLVIILAALPVILIYGPETDAFGGLVHVLLTPQDQLKISDPLARQLFIGFFGTVLGAWMGAIPIPLDWDQPWQKWPISCAAGALVGAFVANFIALVQFHLELKRFLKSSCKKKKT